MLCRTVEAWCTLFHRSSSTVASTSRQTARPASRANKAGCLWYITSVEHTQNAACTKNGFVLLTSAINSWMSTSKNGSATLRHFASRHSYEGGGGESFSVITIQPCWCRWIDSEQIRSRINQQLIAECFGHKGLRGWNILSDTATYLLTINLPTLKSVAMSLYNINLVDICL